MTDGWRDNREINRTATAGKALCKASRTTSTKTVTNQDYNLTDSLNALRRKNALQDSQEIASKLQPRALSPHTAHSLSDLTCFCIDFTRFILYSPLPALTLAGPGEQSACELSSE